MKQKVSNIILLMYSAQFIIFKRLAISVKRSDFKRAYLPIFYKAWRPKSDVLSSFSLRYFSAISSRNVKTLEISNWNYLVLLPPPRKAKQGRKHLVVYPYWLQ